MNLRGEEIIYSTDEVNSYTDTTAQFTVRQIQIEGNKRTKPYIILRELNFHENEQYALHELVEKFRKAKIQLMNSGLFLDVVVSLKA
ncbi:MAG TPA: POTRA domain-containing protein, partial [Chitinophagaceae bacterium]